MPGLITGGKALGFRHNTLVTGSWTIDEYWGTIAAALGRPSTDAPLGPPIAGVLGA